MVAKASLNGLKVLVTRPEQQAQKLCDMILQSGGQAMPFPVIDIVPIAMKEWPTFSLAELDMIIFVSRNAVVHFIGALSEPLLEQIQLVSVGAGSAASMREHGLRVDIQPEQSIGSEGLLLMPAFDDMVGKNVLIIRGKGGRELLANTLVERGAAVHYLEVYERALPTPSAEQCDDALSSECIVCTSVEGVKNLNTLLQKGLKTVLDKPMLVVSERIKTYAGSVGFQHIIVTSDVSDGAVLEQLVKLEI